LSLSPFEDPMMTPKGVVYDMLNIVPYIQKNKKCPVTGQPMTLKDLTKLHFHKNDKEEHHCPVMFKVFTPHTRIVAVKTSGHVYCYEAIENLCYKTKNMKDLLTDTPFTKADVITLQDPHNFENREIENFNYIKTNEQTGLLLAADMLY
jgi:peptidyl-prolyl cis-trans isomerase-like protein 2